MVRKTLNNPWILYFSPQMIVKLKTRVGGKYLSLFIDNWHKSNRAQLWTYQTQNGLKEAKNNQKHLAAYIKQLILSLWIESYKPLTLKVNYLCNVFGFDMSFLVANKYFSIFLDSPALCLDPLIKFIFYKRKRIVNWIFSPTWGMRYRWGVGNCKNFAIFNGGQEWTNKRTCPGEKTTAY